MWGCTSGQYRQNQVTFTLAGFSIQRGPFMHECPFTLNPAVAPVVEGRVDLVHPEFPELCAKGDSCPARVVPEQIRRDQDLAGLVEEDHLRFSTNIAYGGLKS